MKQYFYNLGVWLSQTISVWLGGHPDDSISERTGRAYLANPKGWFRYQRFFIDLFIYLILREKNHCVNSIDGEPLAKEVWDWEKKK